MILGSRRNVTLGHVSRSLAPLARLIVQTCFSDGNLGGNTQKTFILGYKMIP